MRYYKVIHRYRLCGRPETKEIGIYSTEERAREAILRLREKEGFCDTQEGFRMRRVFQFRTPRLLDKTFWVDGFFTYTD